MGGGVGGGMAAAVVVGAGLIAAGRRRGGACKIRLAMREGSVAGGGFGLLDLTARLRRGYSGGMKLREQDVMTTSSKNLSVTVCAVPCGKVRLRVVDLVLEIIYSAGMSYRYFSVEVDPRQVPRAEKRLLEVLRTRGACDQRELLRRLGNVPGCVAAPTLARLVEEGVILCEQEIYRIAE